jgi:Ca2+-binding RTX toxin-like protein
MSFTNGDDVVAISLGTPFVNALAGNDIILLINITSGSIFIDGGSGSDRIDYAGAQDRVFANLTTSFVSYANASHSLQSIENIRAGAVDDELIGNHVSNVLEGNRGSDFIDGGAGNDFIYGDNFITNSPSGGFVRTNDGDDTLLGGLAMIRSLVKAAMISFSVRMEMIVCMVV